MFSLLNFCSLYKQAKTDKKPTEEEDSKDSKKRKKKTAFNQKYASYTKKQTFVCEGMEHAYFMGVFSDREIIYCPYKKTHVPFKRSNSCVTSFKMSSLVFSTKKDN